MTAIITILVGKIISHEFFESRPFKFEQYRSIERLEEAARLSFPIGSDIDTIVDDLKKSGAECYTFTPSEQSKNYEITTTCEYNTNFISLHPLEWYRISLYANKDNKLIRLGVHRVSGLILVIP